MAHLETWWRCPVCKSAYATQKEAIRCASSGVYSEEWAVSHKFPGKAVKVTRWRSAAQALIEAEKKD